MKKLIISLSLCLLGVSTSIAQVPFQMHYETATAVDGDHYSIEAAKEGGPYAYACAGTHFISGATEEKFHVFTLDMAGNIVWEKVLEMAHGRILDVTIGEDNSVAVTGYIQESGVDQLYFALYEGATGNLIGDMVYQSYELNGMNSAGNNIFYSKNDDCFIIGGTEYSNTSNSLQGNAIYMSVNLSNFTPNWIKSVDVSCVNSTMSSINDITEVNEFIYMTGAIDLDGNGPSGYDGSQLLGLLIDPQSGQVVQNLSFYTGEELGSETMGVSAVFNEETERMHLMYNRSIIYLSDHSKPYFLTYKYQGGTQPLVLESGFNAETIALGAPSGFSNDPNIVGLTLVPNKSGENYFFTGILEQAGASNSGIISFFQEIDFSTNQLIGQARYINNSNIASGYPHQGGLFSFHNNNYIKSYVYTPENATVSSDGQYLVSIIPSQSNAGNTYTYDVSSTNMNVAGISSADCLGAFRINYTGQEILDEICSEIIEIEQYSLSPELHLEEGVTTFDINCDYFSKPSKAKGDNNLFTINEFKIYPNPANEILNFELAEEGNYSIEITNLNGQNVYKADVTVEQNFNRIDISTLHSGIYFFKVVSVDGSFKTEKFIKE